MPTIDVDYAEFEKLLGTELHKDPEKIDKVLALAKCEMKLFDENTGAMTIEFKDTNRADLWSIEGLVRTLRLLLGLDRGLKRYKTVKELAEVYVDKRLANIRPYIGCSIIKNLKLTDPMIRAVMQLQDKLDHTYGRNRRRTSIGLYNFDLMTPPFSYTVVKPTEVSFVPLGFEKEMNLREILKHHPKGLEYGSTVAGNSVYPILLDSEKRVLSFPPIINSNDLGRVTEDTRNVLVEVTGTVHETVLNTLKIVTLSLIDRGGKAYSTMVHYPDDSLTVVTPSFETGQMDLDVGYANKVLGLQLKPRQIGKLLEKAGFGVAKLERDKITVEIPCYRIDIMHPIDLIEDVAIAYGYDNIKPFWRKLSTRGGAKPWQAFLDVARELMVGLGFQEVLTFNMTNPENLFTKMNIKKQRIVELANPKVQTLTCLRNWMLPSLLEFLSHNLHIEYPQKVFELGTVTVLDEKSETRTRDVHTLATVISHANASFTEVKSALDALLMNLGVQWQIKEAEHPSFIEGRVGTVIANRTEVGILGEIHPKVLETWALENPVAGFELNIDSISRIRHEH
ncbi:MAG: phenylalanine--tRNA ligase subunit beta [Candidatus Bathyarchaeia archaeon]|jgi:phenylalanyl-tRNA synthetase beta chain